MKKFNLSLSFLFIFLICAYNSNCEQKKVALIGTGYVGLIAGAGLADKGHKIVCVDIDAKKIADLNNGIMPIYEPGLQDLINKNQENICFTTDIRKAVNDSEIIIIAVGTPTDENYESDLRALNAVANSIGKVLQDSDDYKVICIKSTVPVGTNYKIKDLIKTYTDKNNFDMVSNPEFLRAGSAIKDLYEKNPILIGSDSEKALDIMEELYDPFIKNGITLIKSKDFATAEMAKYAWNSLVAVKVSYVNELSRFCNSCNADLFKVIETISFGDSVLPFKSVRPGPGLGGSCLPKDTRAFLKMANVRGVDLSIIKTVIEASDLQQEYVVNQLYSLLSVSEDLNSSDCVKDKSIAILGLSFKANTDDIRISPAIKIIELLLQKGANIKAYDPQATENMRKLFPNITYCNSVMQAVDCVDAIVALTDWKDIKNMDFKVVSQLVKNKIIVDVRNMFDPAILIANGFKFANLGRR
jgi:UDPglucose 6-dehydrogenase